MIQALFRIFGKIRVAPSIGPMRVGLLVAVLIWYASSGFLYFELEGQPDLGWPDAVWWSVVTMATVGYGDLFPRSLGGRYLIGIPTMIFGISVLGYVLSTVASFLVERRTRELKGLRTVSVHDHLVIVHFPSLQRVMEVVDQFRNDAMTSESAIVLVDAHLDELPPELEVRAVRFVRGNPTSERTLRDASAQHASRALILALRPGDPTSDHASLAVALTLEKLWPELHTVAECVDPEHVPLLERCGCDSVVCLEELASRLLVQESMDPGVKELIRQLTDNADGQQFYVVAATGPTWAECRSTLDRAGALALGLRRGSKVVVNPPPTEPVRADDMAVCIALTRPGM